MALQYLIDNSIKEKRCQQLIGHYDSLSALNRLFVKRELNKLKPEEIKVEVVETIAPRAKIRAEQDGDLLLGLAPSFSQQWLNPPFSDETTIKYKRLINQKINEANRWSNRLGDWGNGNKDREAILRESDRIWDEISQLQADLSYYYKHQKLPFKAETIVKDKSYYKKKRQAAYTKRYRINKNLKTEVDRTIRAKLTAKLAELELEIEGYNKALGNG